MSMKKYIFTEDELKKFAKMVCVLQKQECYQEIGSILLNENTDSSDIKVLDYLSDNSDIFEITETRDYVTTIEEILKFILIDI